MSKLLNNTTSLQEVLAALQNKAVGENLDEEISTQETLISEQDAKIAELAEILSSKASVSYPTLSNPGTAENLQDGYELIDGSGNVVVGTHVCSGGSSNENIGKNATVTLTFGGTGINRMHFLSYKYYNGTELQTKWVYINNPSSPYSFEAAVGEIFFVSYTFTWDFYYSHGDGLEMYMQPPDFAVGMFKVLSTENATAYLYDED